VVSIGSDPRAASSTSAAAWHMRCSGPTLGRGWRLAVWLQQGLLQRVGRGRSLDADRAADLLRRRPR
jgi:hypothetical protein